jgi:sec-independent protein translocase protein TatB
MFDIGFSELVVIALVALVVLGPERLPRAARFAGLWVRRARAHWYAVKSEFEQELAADELRRSLHETKDALHEAGNALRGEMKPPQSPPHAVGEEDDGERRD